MQTKAGLGDRIIKVNHAGEHGAIQIYSAQMFMARLTAAHMLDELADFREHERRHRSIFAAELQRRRRPRCRSYWLCGAGGYGLGLITGLLGGSAIAATTVAIERVVLAHLEKQLNVLNGKDPEAVAAIAAVVDEEREHHDRSARRVRPGTFWQKALTPVVSASTEAVIWLGMRL